MTKQKTIDEWLALAFGDEAECPPPGVFLEEEWNDFSADARHRIEQHAAECPACAAERVLAEAFDAPAGWSEDAESGLEKVLDQAGSGPARGERETRTSRLLRFPSRVSRPAVRLAAAAVAVLAVGLVLEMRLAGPPALPDAPVEDVRRGGRVEIESPDGDIGELPRQFLWQPVEDAERYRVTLRAVDDEILWQAWTAVSVLRIPIEVASELKPRVVYFWHVEALGSTDAQIARSERARFRIIEEAGGDLP